MTAAEACAARRRARVDGLEPPPDTSDDRVLRDATAIRPDASHALYREYERRKRAYVDANPGATCGEYERAIAEICRELAI